MTRCRTLSEDWAEDLVYAYELYTERRSVEVD
jgi:hypothetical protein